MEQISISWITFTKIWKHTRIHSPVTTCGYNFLLIIQIAQSSMALYDRDRCFVTFGNNSIYLISSMPTQHESNRLAEAVLFQTQRDAYLIAPTLSLSRLLTRRKWLFLFFLRISRNRAEICSIGYHDLINGRTTEFNLFHVPANFEAFRAPSASRKLPTTLSSELKPGRWTPSNSSS